MLQVIYYYECDVFFFTTVQEEIHEIRAGVRAISTQPDDKETLRSKTANGRRALILGFIENAGKDDPVMIKSKDKDDWESLANTDEEEEEDDDNIECDGVCVGVYSTQTIKSS